MDDTLGSGPRLPHRPGRTADSLDGSQIGLKRRYRQEALGHRAEPNGSEAVKTQIASVRHVAPQNSVPLGPAEAMNATLPAILLLLGSNAPCSRMPAKTHGRENVETSPYQGSEPGAPATEQCDDLHPVALLEVSSEFLGKPLQVVAGAVIPQTETTDGRHVWEAAR